MTAAKPIPFTPRESIQVNPILPSEPAKKTPVAPTSDKPKPKNQTKPLTPKKVKPSQEKLVALYAQIPEADKSWLDHHRIDAKKGLGELISEGIRLLKQSVEK